jgi:hypothetical protein
MKCVNSGACSAAWCFATLPNGYLFCTYTSEKQTKTSAPGVQIRRCPACDGYCTYRGRALPWTVYVDLPYVCVPAVLVICQNADLQHKRVQVFSAHQKKSHL